MANKLDESGDSGRGIILGAIILGRTQQVPVNYFPEVGVVMAGLKPLGKAKDLKKALAIARTKKKFRQSDRL